MGRPEIISLIIGVIIFVVVLLAVLFLLDWRSRRQKTVVIRRSFERAASREGSANIDISNDSQPVNELPQDKNRGRFYWLTVLIASVFGVLLTRLWSLQLLSGDTYQQLAEQNHQKVVAVPATRGRLLDRNGRELVGNRPSLLVTAPRSCADDHNLVYRLSLVLGIPKSVLRLKLLDERVAATANRVLARDISIRQAAYIQTHPKLFANITITESTQRYYPFGTLAAHLLGYIGPVTDVDLQAQPTSGLVYESGDSIGKTGAEAAFESYLAGRKGQQIYQVDVNNNPVKLLESTPPENGGDVCLTLDLDLQRATDRILPQIISSAVGMGRQWCNAGALVAMDIEDGGILAMSSWPTFDPELFTNGISQDLWDSLNAKNSNYPLMNRVTSGTYPAASTFKAFISLAGFYYGLITADTTSYCRGYWTDYGEEWGQYCWLHSGHGTLVFEEAINQSCDVFFYNLAKEFYERWRPPAGVSPLDRVNELQDYLRSFGFGSVTGLDGCTESYGRVPDAAWKRWAFRDTPEEAGWNPGDMTNMSIGQGDILVTPLQICNGYAGIARRKMLKPHIFQQTLDAYGHIQVSYQIRESDQQPQFEEENVKRLEEGFRRVVARNGGPFNQLGVQVLGKTGTGEIASAKETCSWFVAYAPAEAPKYCVACVAEQAGTGDSVAMQAVQFTLGAIYGVDLGPVHAGQGTKER